MHIKFTKMSGAGNDFIILDNRLAKNVFTTKYIARLCDRNFGVGADGLLLVERGGPGCDFTMVYYNADGSEASMCGNGARCFARFVRDIKETKTKTEVITFQTGAGLIEARFLGDEVSINMTTPHDVKLGLQVPTTEGVWTVHSINTGVPHIVCFVNNVMGIDLKKIGSEMRHHPLFSPKGTNVNFVQKTGPHSIVVRTYERGVEAETLACGTGVVASAILAHVAEGLTQPIKVKVRSGFVMEVSFQNLKESFSQVKLQGPAEVSFMGEIDLV